MRPDWMRAWCLGALICGCQAAGASDTLLYIGTRGEQPAAQAPGASPASPSPPGIYAARFDGRTGKLTALGLQQELRGASWLVANPALPILYSVGKSLDTAGPNSMLYTFAIDVANGRLRQLGAVLSGGHDTTQLYLDSRTATLFGASYAGGEVTATPILADGMLGSVASVQKNTGTGPSPRQSAPHAHGVVLDPGQRFALCSDLGADRIFVYRFDPVTRGLSAADPPFEPLPPGSGPRHLVFHPGGKFLYLNTELSAELYVYRWDRAAGRLHRLQNLSLYPPDYTGSNRSSSELTVSHDGRFLYVALRGDQNSVVAYALDSKTGMASEIQRLASQGTQPWALSIDPTGRWMAIANNGSGSVDILAIDRASGRLGATGESLPVPRAAAVAYFAH